MKWSTPLYICAAFLSVSFISCNLDLAPENTYVSEKVYRNATTAQAAVAGCYVRLNVFLSGAPQDQNNYSNTGYVYLLGDLTTQNLEVQQGATLYKAVATSSFTENEHNTLLNDIWNRGYNAVDYANNIIDGIGKYGAYEESLMRRHVAEAKFVRAYVFFQLLTIFGDKALLGNDGGDGIVLPTYAYNGYNPGKHQSRRSNTDCWQQIITDLQEALPNLSTEVPSPSQRNVATQSVAQALLSRVYLYKGSFTNNASDLQQALHYAEEVLNNGAYVFNPNPEELTDALFPSNEYTQSAGYPDPTTYSRELIFAEPSRLFVNQYPNGLNYYRKISYCIPRTFANIYAPDDYRRTRLIVQGSAADNPSQLTTAKFLGGQYDDVIYFRLSEMKLTYAEALTRTTNTVDPKAVAALNDVYLRAFPVSAKPAPFTVSSFQSARDLLQAILLERRREFAFEGQYRWDLIRTNNLLDDTVLGAIPPERWNLPVPDYEIRITQGTIRQNSGYQH